MPFFVVFFEYFKVGLFTIGGGLATLPFLYDLARRTGWFPVDQISNYLATAQILPGAIGINTIAYTGTEYLGVPGGIVAALGAITPSLVIIMVISRILEAFKTNRYLQAAFDGIRPAASGLLGAVCLNLILGVIWTQPAQKLSLATVFASINVKETVVFAIIYGLIIVTKKHPALYIALGAAAGIFLS